MGEEVLPPRRLVFLGVFFPPFFVPTAPWYLITTELWISSNQYKWTATRLASGLLTHLPCMSKHFWGATLVTKMIFLLFELCRLGDEHNTSIGVTYSEYQKKVIIFCYSCRKKTSDYRYEKCGLFCRIAFSNAGREAAQKSLRSHTLNLLANFPELIG